jgi:Domain of unknown function (DUF4349)
MSKSNHPIEQEELMAYLDGELAMDRAVEAAAHMEHCQECQELAADLRKLSQELMAWEVEGPEKPEISAEMAAALAKPTKKPSKRAKSAGWRWGMLFTPSRLAWAGGSAVALLLVMAVSIPNLLRSTMGANESARVARERKELQAGAQGTAVSAKLIPPPPPPSAAPNATTTSFYAYDALGNNSTTAPDGSPAAENKLLLGKLRANSASPRQNSAGLKSNEGEAAEDEALEDETRAPAAPMIARTAALTLITKEFEKTHASVEEILKRYNGYIGELNVSAPDEAGRTLTGTLRIPASRFDSAMAELKKLGRVENESQGGEEVTQQYVDLEARLANAQHTEQRLTEILRQRTGKLQDVLKVELEIDRVRGEVEQMQAEKKELTKRVAFATVNMTVKEEYHAKLQATPPSTGSRFRNAAVDGYNSVVEGLISVGLFLLSSGPSLLLWAAILFFPARWAWRKLRSYLRREESEQAG